MTSGHYQFVDMVFRAEILSVFVVPRAQIWLRASDFRTDTAEVNRQEQCRTAE